VTAQPVAVLGERFGAGRPSASPTICLSAAISAASALRPAGGQGIALIGAVLLAWAAFDALAGVRRVGDGNDDG
jgi:hypothetical protein